MGSGEWGIGKLFPTPYSPLSAPRYFGRGKLNNENSDAMRAF
jgi:hypothetical protein